MVRSPGNSSPRPRSLCPPGQRDVGGMLDIQKLGGLFGAKARKLLVSVGLSKRPFPCRGVLIKVKQTIFQALRGNNMAIPIVKINADAGRTWYRMASFYTGKEDLPVPEGTVVKLSLVRRPGRRTLRRAICETRTQNCSCGLCDPETYKVWKVLGH